MKPYLKMIGQAIAGGLLLACVAARAEGISTNSDSSTHTAPRLLVVKAVYGDPSDTNAMTDVTSQVANMVKDNALNVAASNDNFGDPASGVCKELKVDFTIDGVPGSKSVYERGTLKISLADKPNSSPNPGKLVIRKAVYSDTDGDTIDVTTIVAGMVRNDSLTFTVNDNDLGDPAPDSSKKLQVDYTLNGKDSSQIVDEGKTLKISVEGN
jgi:hypothetical protein